MLRSLHILDTPPEERFDRIVRLATRIFQTPSAYISFVEEDRQWFKARQGVCSTGGSRRESFCGYTILQREPLIIPDTTRDPRFAANPMVTGDLAVRFYAGMPLFASGNASAVGALCLPDRRPRTLDAAQVDILKDLAALVERELTLVGLVLLQEQLLASQRDLAEEKQKSDTLLRNILPERVAEELKSHGRVRPAMHENIAVLFSDFTNFTSVSAGFSPCELLEELNACFSEFDAITGRHGVEKLKTMGDGYLCVSGLPPGDARHAASLLDAALAMRDFIARRQEAKAARGLPYCNVRIGLHAGPAISGVVGTRKFAYDLWGDTLNTASRLEASSEPGRINASRAFADLLEGRILAQPRGHLPVKGREAVEQFFIDGWR